MTKAVSAWQSFKRDRAAIIGSGVLFAFILAVSIGPLIYPASYSEIDFARATSAPSWQYPLGTNDLGQDQLARLLWGGRVSVAVGITAMLVSVSLGTLIGTLAGFCGGLVDTVLMRVTDLFLSLPQLPLLLLIIYLFREPMRQLVGPEAGIFVLIILVIGGLTWMSTARLVRAGFLAMKEQAFVQAARSLGAHPVEIVWRHILPNVVGPVIVAATLGVGNAIITESTLSFLGIGFPPDVPTWGRMLFDAQNYVASAPYLVVAPGLAIFLTVLSVNYLGDGLRDALDVRSR
ncbi:ABC transporter, permease protein, putative [Synechococcus sp. PCC 7335]|uniref:ABC transporter permease n=1 Tax=Synechococcus sp. (strain ATCC 29403 / PCC 7335) TaxID=91464 RepID=UPI00017EE43C|nr:ABC transporter permease [Synechococcus sp. PCC 7335]EDX87115.1 ABC transporter, permease protein, putative [Synechococcus sp. PCC 7335]